MTTLSRKEKYKELREQLAHDSSAGESISTPELKGFNDRLVKIDQNNFQKMEEVNPVQKAKHEAMNKPLEQIAAEIEEQAEKQPLFTLEDYSRNENDSNVGDNDYLNEYIREVKQYNMEQGNAVSEETSLNILQQINEIQKPQKQEPVSRPYARQTKKRNDTADIPFMSPFRSDDDSENTEKIFEDDAVNAESEEPKSREDIMAEVQSLVNGKPPVQRSITVDDDLYSSIEDDRTTRQRLLNETTQMRAQLDGYEDNLSEVNDKMRYTNRILNLVLVVLIIALVVMLFILIYWVVLSRGA